jgi:hypothetical protein
MAWYPYLRHYRPWQPYCGKSVVEDQCVNTAFLMHEPMPTIHQASPFVKVFGCRPHEGGAAHAGEHGVHPQRTFASSEQQKAPTKAGL